MDPPPIPSLDDPSFPFEWNDLFDFSIEDQLLLNLEPSDHSWEPEDSPVILSDSSKRVRKRDPRLVCENFLAGRVPCACPELDDKMVEEEVDAGLPGKKRPRMARTPGVARCQVPGCEADISQLKGYHRRHRVCLKCANATWVVIGGEDKRYCQQCGKFHMLTDFDEGKRSCRRKLERHNNRRRRKPTDSRGAVEKEPLGDLQTEDVSSDGEGGKEIAWSTNQIAEEDDAKEGNLPNGNSPNLCSAPVSQNIENESAMTFTQVDKVVDSSNHNHSPPCYGNNSAYSSMCPTGRISFKLYDWNPAEFPRRLRHQIFQWLASMPIELEGYIRPGCTILTAFISMPHYMWIKLFEDPVSYVRSSVGPGGMLFGRGTALVYFNDLSFRVLRDGASVIRVNVALRAPKLHYVYPPCFEAGKPMDFILCGSNLLQPKFRSLISFAGKYIPHDYYVAFPRKKDEVEMPVDFDNQFCRIYVSHTEPNFLGPAFIEVENECGLSNFIPVLIGDKHVCSEIMMIHQKNDCCYSKKNSYQSPMSSSHENYDASCSRQTAFYEFMLDVAWLLKWPRSEGLHRVVTSSQIQKYNYLLNFLMSNKSTGILQRILSPLQIVLDEIESTSVLNAVIDSDRRLFKKYMCNARDFLSKNAPNDELILSKAGSSIPEGDDYLHKLPDNDVLCPIDHTDCQVITAATNSTFLNCPDSPGKKETVSLLHGDVSMDVTDNKPWLRRSCNLVLSKKLVNPRPFICMIAAVAVCLGVCAVVFHPYKASKFAVTIRRCLFDDSL